MVKTALHQWKELSDEALIDLCRDGETKAFSIILDRHSEIVKKTILGMLGNTTEVDEVTQDVFIRFYNAMAAFRRESKLSTYLTRIAINLSLNVLKQRKNARGRVVSFSEKEFRNIEDKSRNPDVKERREMIVHAVSQLEMEFRSVIVLRLIDGYSVKETAEILKLPMGTVASRLSRGQQKLRRILVKMQII